MRQHNISRHHQRIWLHAAPRGGMKPSMRKIAGFLASSALACGCASAVDERDADGRAKPIPPASAATNGAATGAATDGAAADGGGTPPGTNATNGLTSAAASNDVEPPTFDWNGLPLYARAVRLTHAQWTRSVQDVLKLPEPPTQANSFEPPVAGFTMFTNNERVLEVSNAQSSSYQAAAKEVANAVATDASLARIVAGQDPATFIATLGRRAYRRPLTAEETARYQAIYDAGASTGGLAFTGTPFAEGTKWVIEAMLQSPNFLYRTELGAAGEQLSGYEIAAKLSLWLRGTAPSDALLDQAQAGSLDTVDGFAEVAATMVDEPTATASFTDMHAQLLRLDRLRDIAKSSADYDPATNAELETASLLFFNRVYESGLGLRDVFTGTMGYTGPAMAKLYGLPSPSDGEMTLQDFGAARPGFFSQLPFLVLHGDDTRSDAIHRGGAILTRVLCAELPAPIINVPPLPAGVVAGQSDRERIEHLTGKGTCGETCHSYINPLGYAFENFDGLGRQRTMDEGPVDAQASYPFRDGWKTFNGAGELMELLANSAEAHECYARNIVQFALQRDTTLADEAAVSALATLSESQTGALKEVALGLVQNPVFHVRSSGGAL